MTNDPLTLLDEELSVPGQASLITPAEGLKFTPQADSEFEMSSSVSLKRVTDMQTENSGTTAHNETDIDLIGQEISGGDGFDGNQHLLTGPMLQGLGVRIGDGLSIEEQHMLSQELGESLQVCIRGLLALQNQSISSRFGTGQRSLQPIEDNPLRLGKTYEETVRTLYGHEKSQVHLSAPAAIEEALQLIKSHHEAAQYAIDDALNQILDAFSPDVLLKRFNRYKRTTNTEREDEAWAWDMYVSYFQELASDRQQGFAKLFWEIFEQSYDKKLRDR